MADAEDEWLTLDDWAARCGMSPTTGRRTVAGWVATGRPKHNPIPKPDKVKVERGHARPMWKVSTFEAWSARRPGHAGRVRTSGPDQG